jgi:SAM-dependent methyltransferase
MAYNTDYLLGHGEREWDRLAEQHALWAPTLLDDLELAPGSHVVEVGCGNGVLLRALADAVGPGGRAVGLDRDPRAALEARRNAPQSWVEVRAGDVQSADLGDGYDLAVARWVLSFVPEPGLAVARMGAALAPGGRLVAQDYLHDCMRVFPERPEVARVIDAFRAAYRDTGGDLWVAGRLPGLLAAAGLRVLDVRPHAKAGPPGSPPFRWVERFLFEHLDTVLASGHLSQDEAATFAAAWGALTEEPGAVLFTPLVVTVVATNA